MAFGLHKLCFINAASRYHSSPVKQRAVHKDSKGGIAHNERFPPFPMKKAPERSAFPRPLLKIAISLIGKVINRRPLSL